MSNLSSKILRSIVAAELSISLSEVMVSGCIASLPTHKDWYGFYQSESGFYFNKIETTLLKPLFLVSVYKGQVTVLILLNWTYKILFATVGKDVIQYTVSWA